MSRIDGIPRPPAALGLPERHDTTPAARDASAPSLPSALASAFRHETPTYQAAIGEAWFYLNASYLTRLALTTGANDRRPVYADLAALRGKINDHLQGRTMPPLPQDTLVALLRADPKLQTLLGAPLAAAGRPPASPWTRTGPG